MYSSLRIALCVVALAFALSLRDAHADEAADIIRQTGAGLTDKDPKKRADAAENVARADNKTAAGMIMRAMATETDAEAGARMGAACSLLKSEEAVEEIGKAVVRWSKSADIFKAYWTLTGVARGDTEKGDALLKAVMLDSKSKEFFLKAAAAEAIAEGPRAKLAPLIGELLNQWAEDWDTKGVITALSGISAASRLVNSGTEKEVKDPVMLGIVNVLEKTKSDRVQYFCAKALSDISGEKTYTDPKFWRWWIEHGKGIAMSDDKDGATTAGRDVPRFFDAMAVGKRVVYVIDVSGSMSLPAAMPKHEKPPEQPKEKGPITGGGKGERGGKKADEPPPPPDYSKVKTKMDLAKVELIYSLRQLPEDYLFNIVIYHTPSDYIDQATKSLIQATKANKERFIKLVEKLQPLQLTNIHGGLVDGLTITDRGLCKGDIATDELVLAFGAETIFFLTDGSPTWSDDSDMKGSAVGGVVSMGNGKFVKPDAIIADIKRINTFRKCVIHTVGIGPHNGGLLMELARSSGGNYIDRTGVAPK